MSNEKLTSIIDFGSSNLRLGTFGNSLLNSKFVTNIDLTESVLNNSSELNKKLNKLILNSEKEINRHLKELTVMVDTPDCFAVDLSLKKKIDKSIFNKSNLGNYLQEAKNLIKKNYFEFKILHLVISKYIVDGEEVNDLPDNIIIDELIIDITFILIPEIVTNQIKINFIKNHISVTNFYCSSYVKTLDYKKNFDHFNIKIFIDIGFKKTSILVYKKNRLMHFNVVPIGGHHITNDISKVLKINYNDSEAEKALLKHSNTIINNEDSGKLLVKVVHARVEEMIDLCFKNIDLEITKNQSSILIFTGGASKILSKNSIYLNNQFNIFNEMSFYEENADIICSSGYNYIKSDNPNEATFVEKKIKKQGIFEKLFYILSR